ncbi:MAG: addiction module protein [Methylococcales bacterium]|nr:addiction module protein [Methylococcales bacterium]
MNLTELHNLPAIEKLIIIEALWGDLVADEGNLTPPPWHENELKETEDNFLLGNIEIVDWQAAKKELRSKFE